MEQFGTVHIASLRDFLVHLCDIAGPEYNNAVSYVVWKVLAQCLASQVVNEYNGQDWRSHVGLFYSENWLNGTYSKVLQTDAWKEHKIPRQSCELHPHTSCNRHCYPSDTVYYCFTCTMNPLYEICVSCFDEAKHKGHLYTSRIVQRPEGRVCHCGDPSAFKNPAYAFQCAVEENNNPSFSVVEPEFGGSARNTNVIQTFNQVLDFIIDILVYLKEESEFQSLERKDFSHSHRTSEEVLSTGDRRHLRSCENKSIPRTILEQLQSPNIPIASSLDGPSSSEIWALQIDGVDNSYNYLNLIRKISYTLNKPKEYAIKIVNELQNSMNDTVTLVESKNLKHLKKLASEFQDEGLILHLRKVTDIFKVHLVQDLLDWLQHICMGADTTLEIKKCLRLSMLDAWQSRLMSTKMTLSFFSPYVELINLLGGFIVPFDQRESFPWFSPWGFSDLFDPHTSQIMDYYDKRLLKASLSHKSGKLTGLHGSRFQYLLINSSQHLSRAAQSCLFDIISVMFSIRDEAKNCLAAQYLDIYLPMLYGTVSSDSSTSKISFMSIISQYTFQDPGIAKLAITHHFIERTLKYAFTLMGFSPEDLLVCFPIALSRGYQLPNGIIKNKKPIIAFKDLCLLMSTNMIPIELLESKEILHAILECCTQFSSILSLKRETAEHVEFENFDFSYFYFFFPSILIMTDGYFRSIASLSNKEYRKRVVKELVEIVTARELEFLSNNRSNQIASDLSPLSNSSSLFNVKKSPNLLFSKERICNHTANVINFKVGVDPQSFFSPLSYILKFILQWSRCGRYDPVPRSIVEYINYDEMFPDPEKNLLISESSLSTLVLIGQINVGFWIRNGSPISHQHKMYTQYSLREFAYFSDLFNVQFSMSRANPDDFIVTYLARWGLKNWANGIPMGDYPDTETTLSIVYQSFLLLIQLLTDIRSLTMVSSIDGFEKTLKAEIIHAVAFKTCTFNDIVAAIPEHITNHAAFDLYLEKYTNYFPPTSSSDSGTFSLKSHYVQELNPYYIGLPPNRRYEIEKSIRTNMSNQLGVGYEDTFIHAENVQAELKNTPYSELFAISSTDTFGMFLKNTLEHILKLEAETLLGPIVHFVHLCVVNNLRGSMKVLWREYTSDESEFCHYHSIGSVLYCFLLEEKFVNNHAKIREIFRYLAEVAPHVNIYQYLKEQTINFHESILLSSKARELVNEETQRKKKLAKERKLRIMKKLAKQQLQFIENNLENGSDFEEKTPADGTRAKNITAYKSLEDESCVFCKMINDEDIFVYFTYQEQNMCDQGIDFTDISSVESLLAASADLGKRLQSALSVDAGEVKSAPVLRACGHGAHISCLSSHMASICASHSQTTKNVPDSYGFGLAYCPLCNGLCNSFLPKMAARSLVTLQDILDDGRIAKSPNYEPKLVSVATKAAGILQDLVGTENNSVNGACDFVGKLLVSTISNLELSLRFTKDDSFTEALNDISSPKLLTVKLLANLNSLLLDQAMDSSEGTAIKELSLQILNSNTISNNLLGIWNQFLGCHTSAHFWGNPVHAMKRLIIKKLHQDMLLLANELVAVDFYSDETLSTPWKYCPSNGQEPATNELEIESIIEIFKNYVAILLPRLSPGRLNSLDLLGKHLHYLVTQSLLVFTKRCFLITFAYYATTSELFLSNGIKSRLEMFLSFFRQNPLLSLLNEFAMSELPHLREEMKTAYLDSNFKYTKQLYSDISQLEAFTFSGPPNLVKLPKNLSALNNVEKGVKYTSKLPGTELSICLFCGQRLFAQKLIPLQNFVQGECTNHVKNECPKMRAYGIFLLVRSNTIYFSYSQRGSFFPTPYLNRHGITDSELKYSDPMYLDQERYMSFTKEVVLGNLIPHIVFRTTEGNFDLGGWETI